MSESLEQGGRADAARGVPWWLAYLWILAIAAASILASWRIERLEKRCDNLESQVRILKGQR